MYNIVADLHTHTLSSTHAFSTIFENITAAAEKGLYALGITDHGHVMPGAPGPWYFENLYQLPLVQKGVKVLMGMETNIIDFSGKIDYQLHDRLDFLIASIHDIPGVNLDNPTTEKCTELYLSVAENPHVNIIGHSGTPKYKYDYEKVIPQFGKNNKLVEINSHTFLVRPKNVPNCLEIALLCKKHGVRIVVNSDAHYHTDIGLVDPALEMLKSIDFPPELIVNSSAERLEEYIKNHTRVYSNRIC